MIPAPDAEPLRKTRTAVQDDRAPGGPADLDEILAEVLWARYGPAPG